MGSTLEDEIRAAINRASRENASNTPDFILAEYLTDCLMAYERAHNRTLNWWQKGAPPSLQAGQFNPDAPMTTPDTSGWERSAKKMSEPL
jgi:hypothetical protein